MSSGNDIELRRILSPVAFGVAVQKRHPALSLNIGSIGGLWREGVQMTRRRPPAPYKRPPPPVVVSAISYPVNLEDKLKQLHDMVPYIRNRILFGINWVSYADDLDEMEREDTAALDLLARNLNKTFLKHQVSNEQVVSEFAARPPPHSTLTASASPECRGPPTGSTTTSGRC